MAKLFSVQLENDEFHKKLGGGIPSGTLALIKGEHGSGKSAICQRIVFGLLKNDVTVTYISTQLTTLDFIKQMSSLGYDVVKSIVRRKLLFIPVYPLLQEPKQRGDYSKKLMSAKELFENDVIVIDSFTTLVKYDIDPESVVSLMGFFKRVVALDKAVILTGTNEIDEDLMNEIESACSMVAETSIRKFGTDLKNVMVIKKYNLAVGQYSKQIAFRVEPKIGLVVEIAAVA